MTVEILLIAVVCGITVLAYMVAINAHGPLRLSLSYFLATMMLAGTVWVIVQYVNRDLEAKKMAELSRLEIQRKAEEDAYKQNAETLVLKNRVLTNNTTKLVIMISNASNIANMILNADLQNKEIDFETLLKKASDAKHKVDDLAVQYAMMDTIQSQLPEPYLLIKEGLGNLSEAAINYKNFYYSEDSTQETQREKLLRIRAKEALEKFNKASSLLNK
jgi:hypothetical protein